MANTESQTARILKLGVDEMFEDLTYNIAYDEVLKRLKDNGMPEGVLRDAVDSGISIMFSAALMVYIQKQEQILYQVISSVGACFLALFNPLKGLLRSKFSKLKGRKFSKILNFFSNSVQDRANVANALATSGQLVVTAKNSANSHYSVFGHSIQQRDHILKVKDQQLAYAKAKVDTINQTLLFKLFASKFSANDKEILRRITGSEKVDVEQLNKVSQFMFTTDSAGNIIGLSEQFMTLLNGLGYFNGKEKK